MNSSDNNVQKMEVIIMYTYEEEIFEGENDMYAVAEDAQKYIEKEIYDSVQSIGPVTNFGVKVKPQLF